MAILIWLFAVVQDPGGYLSLRLRILGYSGEGERSFRWQAERRSGAKVNSSRSEATLTR